MIKLKLFLMTTMFFTGQSFADNPNTTIAPDWYYDTALGLTNGVAKTINYIPFTNMEKAITWTEKEAVNKDSKVFTISKDVGATTTMWAGGKLVKGVVNVFKPLPKPKANKEDLDKAVNELKTTKEELKVTKEYVHGLDTNLNTLTEKVFSNP